MLRALAVLLVLSSAALAADPPQNTPAAARQRWSGSPHGPMLERILPPGFEPSMLPQPKSRGAQLEVKYCVQCHNLPNPAMHHSQKWPAIYDRMVARMEGRGNMGKVMAEMMAGVSAPSAQESKVLVAYLQQNAQKPLDPVALPAIHTPAAEAFRLACQQCHVLPDPGRHTAREWPAVVTRMQSHMEWMNRVVGSKPGKDEPQLRLADINAFLARHARRTQ